MHPEDRERLREAWRGAVKAASPLALDLRIRGKDGTFRWFHTRAVPICDERGAVTRWYGIHTDVDDLKRATAPAGRGRRTGGVRRCG